MTIEFTSCRVQSSMAVSVCPKYIDQSVMTRREASLTKTNMAAFYFRLAVGGWEGGVVPLPIVFSSGGLRARLTVRGFGIVLGPLQTFYSIKYRFLTN